MPSVPSLIRHRFRRVAPGANGLRMPSGPGVAVLLERASEPAREDRILEVIATGTNVHAAAADLVVGHLKSHPSADVYAQAAVIPDSADRDRAVRELSALCTQAA